jgi:hypothetical protein
VKCARTSRHPGRSLSLDEVTSTPAPRELHTGNVMDLEPVNGSSGVDETVTGFTAFDGAVRLCVGCQTLLMASPHKVAGCTLARQHAMRLAMRARLIQEAELARLRLMIRALRPLQLQHRTHHAT